MTFSRVSYIRRVVFAKPKFHGSRFLVAYSPWGCYGETAPVEFRLPTSPALHRKRSSVLDAGYSSAYPTAAWSAFSFPWTRQRLMNPFWRKTRVRPCVRFDSHWRHLENTIERPALCGDAVCRYAITMTTCCSIHNTVPGQVNLTQPFVDIISRQSQRWILITR